MVATLGAFALIGCDSGASETAAEAKVSTLKLADGIYALPYDSLTGGYDEKWGYCGSHCTTVEKFEAACTASQNIQKNALTPKVNVDSDFRQLISNNGYDSMKFEWYPEDKWCVATVAVSGILDGNSVSMKKRFMAEEIEISDGIGRFSSIEPLRD